MFGCLQQAPSQKILLCRAFEEKLDPLILQLSPGAVEEFIIAWCMLEAHIHEGWHLFVKKCILCIYVLNLHYCFQ